ncbi:glycosyltransferase, partial [Georgenia sp. MJ170]|uniref:glycosyltransferase n=1 Tax=Georgenia sunbinii TaxID=3117728 RepID=UPI002F25EF4D
FRSKHDWLGDRPLALYCGTLGRVNDATYIVRLAAEALKVRPDYRFLVVGDGSERDSIMLAAESSGVLRRNFFMFERRSKDDLPDLYSAATVALSTVAPVEALWANSANKVFDALAAGKPVAINHLGWQADLLQASGAGVVLDPADMSSALARLSTLMDDPEQAERAGSQARRLATDRFARDIHGAQLADLLEQSVL